MPSIRRRLSPSRCCAGSSPGAAAESLQTDEVGQGKGGEIGQSGEEKSVKLHHSLWHQSLFNQNGLICFHANTERKKHALIEAPGQIISINHRLFHPFLESLTQKVLHSSLPSNHLDLLPGSTLRQTTHQPTANQPGTTRHSLHQTNAQQKQRWWWNLLAQTHWGRLYPPAHLKVSPVIYMDVQWETNLDDVNAALCGGWGKQVSHTHRQHGSVTLPGFRGRTRGEKTIRRRRSKGTQRERKWSGVKQQEVIYLVFVMCLEIYISLRTPQKCYF